MSTNVSTTGHFGPSHDDTSSLGSGHAHDDLDLDFSLTESGRTVAHLVSHLKDDFADTPDFVGKALAIAEEEEPELTSSTGFRHDHQEQQLQSNHQPYAMNDNQQPQQQQEQQQQLRRSQPKAIPQELIQSNHPGSGSQGSPSSFLNAMSHTPPGALAPTSYEAQHFGKRIRSGSISGRLRSASDLEDLGFIDRQQKTVLKDLIISGDEALQSALDKFESGDTSTLQNLIQSGAFSAKATQDIDLLGDLDLDFLTVDDDYAGMEAAAVAAADNGTSTADNMQVTGNVDGSVVLPPPALQQHQSEPIPMQPPPHFPTKQQVQQMMNNLNNTNTSNLPAPNMVSPSLQSAYGGENHDGIGELDFNGEFAGGEQDYVQLPSTTASAAQVLGQGKAVPSPDLQEQTRFRSNSLAFGALLSADHAPESGDAQEVYGRWMNPNVASQLPNNNDGNNNNATVKKVKATSSKGSSKAGKKKNSMQTMVQDADGGLHILNPNQQQQAHQGGIGASLAQYGRSKSDSKLQTKKQLAEERRREKQLKKDQKEREKREKKERREQEMREKKERDARDRAEKKQRKAAAVKAKQQKQKQQQQQQQEEVEERKETPSGLGRPRSMSDPNLKVSTDMNGLMEVDRPDGWIGAYSPESRKMRIERFLEKRNHRVWTKTVKYDVRKNFADSRLRVKGRFVKKEDELLMRDLMSLT